MNGTPSHLQLLACLETRLAAMSPLSGDTRAMLARAVRHPVIVKPQRDLLREGQQVTAPLAILSGWAVRVRLLEDGRRQVFGFLLPGEVICGRHQFRPRALTTVVSLNRMSCCRLPSSGMPADLSQALAMGQALEEAHLLAHILRLGRLNADERLIDLFLELRTRLDLCGLLEGDVMPFPLTQEVLADATGLTQVHVNRTLQQMRRRGDIELTAGRLRLLDPAKLAQRVGYREPRVMTDEPVVAG